MSNLIYIVSEDIQRSNHIKQFLAKQGYEWYFFENSDKLYEAFLLKKCALAIIDMDISDSDNFAVCAKIRQFSSLPIMLITSENPDEDYIYEDYVFGMSLGIDAYLTKPLNDIKLLSHIRTLLMGSHCRPNYLQLPCIIRSKTVMQ